MIQRKAIVLINLGTPDEPKIPAVYRYLTQFLNDKRVIDLPYVLRKLLVNTIIIPFRVNNSTQLYKQLWTPLGSPLLIYLEGLQFQLKKMVGDEYEIHTAMRYGKPSMKTTFETIRSKNYEEVIIFPLFPQYASSTTGSVYELLTQLTKDWQPIPNFKFISQFHNHPAFIRSFVKQIQQHDLKQYDHIIFSYHGLPNRHLDKIHPEVRSINCSCEVEKPSHGMYCYKATCYETTRLLVNELNLSKEQFSVGFQSRLSKNWMTPFTDETIIAKAKQGHKKILIVAPSFVADCLETTIELGHEYKELFEANGGQELTLVESLNAHDFWAEAIVDIIKE